MVDGCWFREVKLRQLDLFMTFQPGCLRTLTDMLDVCTLCFRGLLDSCASHCGLQCDCVTLRSFCTITSSLWRLGRAAWQAVATETSALTAPLLLPVLEGVEDDAFRRLAATVQRCTWDLLCFSGHVCGGQRSYRNHMTSLTQVNSNHTSKLTLCAPERGVDKQIRSNIHLGEVLQAHLGMMNCLSRNKGTDREPTGKMTCWSTFLLVRCHFRTSKSQSISSSLLNLKEKMLTASNQTAVI